MYFVIAEDPPKKRPPGVSINGIIPKGGFPAINVKKERISNRLSSFFFSKSQFKINRDDYMEKWVLPNFEN